MRILIETVPTYNEDFIEVKTEVIHYDMIKTKIDTFSRNDFESLFSLLMRKTLEEFEEEFKKTILKGEE
jgi:hypothetical protein